MHTAEPEKGNSSRPKPVAAFGEASFFFLCGVLYSNNMVVLVRQQIHLFHAFADSASFVVFEELRFPKIVSLSVHQEQDSGRQESGPFWCMRF